MYVRRYTHMYRAKEITGGHWPFSVQFSKMADQNIKQDTFKHTNGESNSYRYEKMANQLRNLIFMYKLKIDNSFFWGYNSCQVTSIYHLAGLA